MKNIHYLRQNFQCFHLINICRCGKCSCFHFGLAHSFNITNLIDLTAHYQCKRTSITSCTAGSSDSMHIIFNFLRYIKINDRFHITNINTSCSHIRGNQHITGSITERGHNPVTHCLRKIPVETFCKISSSFQMLCQLFHHFSGVAENQSTFRIVIIQKSCYSFPFIFTAYFIIILLNRRYRQFLLYGFNKYRIILKLTSDIQNRLRHSGRKQYRLMLSFYLRKNRLHIFTKSHIQHFIRLIQNHRLNFI